MIERTIKLRKLLPLLWLIGSAGWAISAHAQSNIVWLRCAWGGGPTGGSNIYGIDSAKQRVGVLLFDKSMSWVPDAHFTATYVQFTAGGKITVDRQSLSIKVEVPNDVSRVGQCQTVADPTAGNKF